jgi:hypothetical protein
MALRMSGDELAVRSVEKQYEPRSESIVDVWTMERAAR